ncbi:MAG TPA: T9SS type A sorting domain-containing protein [Flavobacterium sp.]|nr:T9SS type A sorting domain-containing protein [Flavobacterium sp.]
MKNNYFTKISVLFVFCSVFTSWSQYNVTSIPSQAYAVSLPVGFTMDDTYSELLPLTFDFEFFGNTYNQVLISTNGYIDFNGVDPGHSPWSFSTTIPDTDFPVKNSFLGCYHDIFNADGSGTVTYGVSGSAPYRKFVVIYDNNNQFSCNANAKSSIQMVLYETLNILDSQILKKELCANWNGGNAVVGVINIDGSIGITPPGRNTSMWETENEAWRFMPTAADNQYHFTKCDNDADGLETFNLQIAQNDLWAANPTGVSFHATFNDALSQTAPLPVSYTNALANAEKIYANVNGVVKTIFLKVVDCTNDFDGDTVDNSTEDLDGDSNLANDDTDSDGIPDFIDNDDDGDLVLTNEEYVFTDRNAQSPNAYLDTDNDGILNYLDNDDDGDGVLTINEDYNGNTNPGDDDTNSDGIPDYLDNSVAMGVSDNQSDSHSIMIYPNPASNVLNIANNSNQEITNITVYSVTGILVKQLKQSDSMNTISVSDLQSGVYFVKIQLGSEILNYKFIKK